MPVPPNVSNRRNISVTTGTSTIPAYNGLQNVVFLGTAGKPDLPAFNPPYPPDTPVPAGTKYLDVMDNGVEPLPASPGSKYVCYLCTGAPPDPVPATWPFIVDIDTFPNKDIRHNYAGWPNPTE